MKHKRLTVNRKGRPRNEITEVEVETFLSALRNYAGYPKLRDLKTLLPSMDLYKINVILRYLERSGVIIVDNDGYIIWIRNSNTPEFLTLGDVANLSDDLKKYLAKEEGEEGES
jgi:hypothetical protein